MAGKRLTRAQARAALGDMPERTFARLVSEGAPMASAAQLFRWYVDREVRKAKQQEREKSEALQRSQVRPDWEERALKAKADLAELDVRERRRMLVPRPAHDKEIARLAGVLRGSVSGMKSRYANRILMIETPATALAKLEEIERAILGELQQAVARGADDEEDEL